MHAALYARISQDRDGVGLGVKRQEQDCRKLATQRGWEVTATFIDNDLSAYSGKIRPGYSSLLDAIEAKAVDAVVVWHLDRLHRHPKELEEFIELCDRKGVALASVSGDVDLSTAEGRLMARIQGAVARKESEDKSRRIARKHIELAKAGKYGGGGRRPYGYSNNRSEIIEAEANNVHEAVQRLLSGDTLRAIAIDFNKRGIPSAQGRQWSNVALRNMLLSPGITGLRSHKGEIIAEGQWPALIERGDWNKLRALLTDPARRTTPQTRIRHLLSGELLRCAKCGYKLFSTYGSNNKTRYYGCITAGGGAGGGHVYINGDMLDEFMTEAVFVRLQRVRIERSTNDESSESQIVKEIADDQVMLDELAGAYAAKQISMRELLAARLPIQSRIENATKRLRHETLRVARDEMPVDVEDLRATWTEMSVDRKRSVIKSILNYAIIHPAIPGLKHFDRNRVEPVWAA